MARRGKHHRKQGMTIPLAVVGGFAPLTIATVNGFRAGGMQYGADRLVWGLTGYSPTAGRWDVNGLRVGALPIGVGFLIHSLASRLGINRALSRARIPFIRI